MNLKPPSCVGCPAYECGKSFVPGVGPPTAKLVIMGQGPGEEEAYNGVPFIGRSGQMLDRWLVRAGLRRHTIWIGNVVQCWLPGNRPPTMAEITYCRQTYWGAALTQLTDLKVLVPVGIPAMKTFIHPKATSENAGVVYRYTESSYILGLLHPAFIMRGAWEQEPVQVLYLQRAKQIMDRGSWDILDPTTPISGALLDPTEAEMDEWIMGLDNQGVAVDIETAGRHIIMVGMCRLKDYRPIVFHFMRQGGVPAHPKRTAYRVRAVVQTILSNHAIPKVFHNGQAFDIPILERNGFKVEGYKFDTMLAQHIAYAELPKGLEFCSKLYLGAGGWKSMLEQDSEGEWK